MDKIETTKLDELEAEFYRHSNGIGEKDIGSKVLALAVCDEILLDVIDQPDWKPGVTYGVGWPE